MKKRTKTIIAVALLALVMAGIWFYNNQVILLADQIPEEVWKYQIFITDVPAGEAEDAQVDQQDLDAILDAVRKTYVTRGPKKDYVSDHAYSLYLYPYEGYPTLIIVNSDGTIALAQNLDLDHYRYYKDGGELYSALTKILMK